MTSSKRPGGAAPDTPANLGPSHVNPTPRGNVFQRFAVRSLTQNRSRTIVSIVGIALSCALITAIFTSVTTIFSGMLTAELERSGAWQLKFENMSDASIEKLEKDSRITTEYKRRTYGAALMPESFEGYWGRYFTVQEWPTSELAGDLVVMPMISEGRAPKSPDEIVLPESMKGTTVAEGRRPYEGLPDTGKDQAPRITWQGGLDVGTTFDAQLGQRTFHDRERKRDRACLANDALYSVASDQGDILNEWLADPDPARRYTVVGFYAEPSTFSGTWQNNAGYLAFTSGDGQAPRSTDVYVSTTAESYAEIEDLISDYTGMEHSVFDSGSAMLEHLDTDTIALTHNNLLRYQGVDQDRAIYSTLYLIALILAIVVVVASISLIYNSFAIAVSERTRQYGLLASLGASARQLRRTVYTEALLLALVGIPAGILLGLAGTWVVFQFAGEGIGAIIDAEVFEKTGFTALSVSPAILAICVALSLVTVIVSAAVPAIRASRVSAIDAIRQSRDVRLSRREQRRDARNTRRANAARPGWLDALRRRVGGIPGWIAHRNLTRATNKGRVAVASLAVSVALLIASCAIGRSLGQVSTIAQNDAPSDLQVSADLNLSDQDTVADGVARIDGLYTSLGKTAGAKPLGYLLSNTMYASADPGVLNADNLTLISEENGATMPIVRADGGVVTPVEIMLIDDASWRKVVREAHLDEGRFCDPDHPTGIALNKMQANTGSKYATLKMFDGTGELTLYTLLRDPAAAQDGMGRFLTGIEQDAEGNLQAVFDTYSETGMMEEGRRVAIEDALASTYELPIGAALKHYPETLAAYQSNLPCVILPISSLPTLAAADADLDAMGSSSPMAAPFNLHEGAGGANSLYTYFSFNSDSPRETGEAMQQIVDEAEREGWNRAYLSNNAEQARQSRLIYETIRLFIGCFAFITGTIAVANVFNTLSNSIILRKREFAMLKSCGMGPGAFRRMIVLECASYAWRGLAIGIALGGLVAFALHQAMLISFYGTEFTLPIWWLALASAIVIGVLAISAIYALRKAGANSIVQTLREDAL